MDKFVSELNVVDGVDQNKPKSIENYLPPNYPRLVFQGTHGENSESIKMNGLGGGSLTTDIMDCLDYRYLSNNGKIVITEFDPKSLELEEVTNRQFKIKENTGPKRYITFKAIDTDGVSSVQTSETTRYVEPTRIDALNISNRQQFFVRAVNDLFTGNLCQKVDQAYFETIKQLYKDNQLNSPYQDWIPVNYLDAYVLVGAEMKNRIYSGSLFKAENKYILFSEQQLMAKTLGIDVASFLDRHSLESAIQEKFGGEVGLIKHLAKIFPDKLDWEWKNTNIDDKEAIEHMLQQIYQTKILNNTELVLNGTDISKRSQLILSGPSSEKLVELTKKT